MREHLKKKQKQLLEQKTDFYTARGIHVYFKDPVIDEEIDVERVIAKVEGLVPTELLSEVEMIIIGWFDEFEDRNINAFYKDGILHITNEQDNEADMIDDIVHEIAHSIEGPYGYEIYGDQNIKEEFLEKRQILHDKLRALGFKAPNQWFLNTEFDEEFDNFLFQKIGKDKLRMICMGLFINAYAAVSLREYFATGFADFYMHPDHNFFKKVSPTLYKKLLLIQDIKNLDNTL